VLQSSVLELTKAFKEGRTTMKIRICKENRDKIQKALNAVQLKCSERTITVDDIICSVKDVEIAESDDGRELYARIIYSVRQDGVFREYQTITKL
jgi:lysyl-tRNA synthetase class I